MNEAIPLGFKWPWQTREDTVIRLLDAAIEDAQRRAQQVRLITESARKEARRRNDREFERDP